MQQGGWTSAHDEYLRTHHRNMTAGHIAAALGCGENTVRKHARAMRLSFRRMVVRSSGSMTVAEVYAAEHIAWFREQGGTIRQALAAIEHPVPDGAGWDDVVEIYATAWTQMNFSRGAA